MEAIVVTHTASEANELHILLDQEKFEPDSGNPFIGKNSEHNKTWYWYIKDNEPPVGNSYSQVLRKFNNLTIYSLSVFKIKLDESRGTTDK